MISIYCLINPADNRPFYVGATTNAKNRLNQHIRESERNKHFHGIHINILRQKPYWWKCNTIGEIVAIGKKPIIKLLFVTEAQFAGLAEEYFYKYFMMQGIELQQTHNRFYNLIME